MASEVAVVLSSKDELSTQATKLPLSNGTDKIEREQLGSSDIEIHGQNEDIEKINSKKSTASEAEPSNTGHFVEYRDVGGFLIAKEPWKEPFDLSQARKGLKIPDTPVFEIVTVLNTSIPADSNRWASEKAQIMENGILNNAKVRVTQGTTKLIINSTDLMKIFRSIIKYYPMNLEADMVELEEPYMIIAHHLKDFQLYIESGEKEHESIGRKHLKQLLDIYYKSTYNLVVEEQARHSEGICTCQMLWLLYKPGTTVYCETEGKIAAYVIQSVHLHLSRLITSGQIQRSYDVRVWNLKYDGRFIGRCSTVIHIPHFDGERKISSLKVIPRHFIDKEDGGKIRNRLEDDGEKWFKLLRGGQVHHTGQLLHASGKEFHGRLYIDSSSYYERNDYDKPDIHDVQDMGNGLPKCGCEDCQGLLPHPKPDFPWARYDVIDPTKETSLEIQGSVDNSRQRYLLCERLLFGFDLKSREWVKVDIANCKPPKTNARAIDTLVMPPERKDMIKALIQRFTDKDSSRGRWAADFIENKGEGQIFLLHGSPGVGKTFTAECIAEYTGRPLMSLTCGDIGTDETKMETELMKWFKLAEKWGAIMLIDEADVFLEKRYVADLKRNSLVSVFLRCIEYYRGVMFLTTNRVGHFDDAFMSRIHVVIYYDKLSPQDQKKIWEQFFNKLTDDRQDFVITRGAKNLVFNDDFVTDMGWNGREIRNAFQTAVALADYRFLQEPNKQKDDGPKLEQRDIEQVCNMVREFKKYLIEVHGADEDGRAFVSHARKLPES